MRRCKDKKLESGIIYTYTVTAVNKGGESEMSAEVGGTPGHRGRHEYPYRNV